VVIYASMQFPATAIAETTASLTNQTTPIIYNVSPDGQAQYPTIEAALAAATDPAIDKIIQLAPGTYQYPLEKNTRLRLMVPRTHIKSSGPAGTKIIASSGKGNNSWGVVEVRAPHCSVEGVWIENRWKKGDPPNKQTALAVGTAEDPKAEPDGLTELTGIRITNCKMTGTTSDRHSDNLAWDVVTVGANVTGCLFENCEMRGFADVFSTWARRVDVKNCTIHAKGWNAIWVASGPKVHGSPEAVSTYTNCRLASSNYHIAGGAATHSPATPLVFIKDCTSVHESGVLPEIARMLPGSLGLAIIYENTLFQPFGAIKDGPEGFAPTTLMPSYLLTNKWDFLQ